MARSVQLDEQCLEVGPVLEPDGMVDGLAKTLSLGPAPSAESPADGVDQVRLGNPAGAGCLEEETPRLQKRSGQRRQSLVGPQGTGHLTLAVGEGRWIEHDQIEPLTLQVVQYRERIAGLEPVLDLTDPLPIEGHVGSSQGERRSARIDRGDRRGPAGGCVNRETTGASENVEHAAVGAERADQLPIVSLVEKVAGLVTLEQVGLEAKAVLPERDRAVVPGSVDDRPVALPRPTAACGLVDHHLSAKPQDHVVALGLRRDCCGQVGKPGQPRGGVQLDDDVVLVLVDHESAQPIVFSVDQSVSGGVFALEQRGPSLSGPVNGVMQPGVVNGQGVADVQDPDGDRRSRVVEPDPQEPSIVVEDHGEIARPARLGRSNRAVENPRMSGPNAPLGVFRHANRDSTLPGRIHLS